MNQKTIRWGILGCGNIASIFASDFRLAESADLYAVASRSAERAKSFAKRHSASRYYGDYAGLLADPDVDAVYVATPHMFHRDIGLQVIDAGKALFCEKPLSINRSQTDELISAASSAGVFLGEAMWTAFFPAAASLQALVDSRALGELVRLEASFTARIDKDEGSRWLNIALGGGALLDLGVYPLAFSRLMFRRDIRNIQSMAVMGSTGVDTENSIQLDFGEGKQAALLSGFRFNQPQVARLFFERGGVFVPDFFHPGQYVVYPENDAAVDALPSGEVEDIENIHPDAEHPGLLYDFEYDGRGYQFEIESVSRDILAGRTASAVYPLQETGAVMEIMDGLRGEWGLRYPGE